MTLAWRARAPAKINLGLFVGGVRSLDGRHELVSVMQSISLADELVMEPAPPGSRGDVIVCAGVAGPNLAADALRSFRAETGWGAPALRVVITKHIPVAAGLAGGSTDAAAVLRMAASAASASGLAVNEDRLIDLAAGLGADVPGALWPGRVLAQGAGERLQRLPDPDPFGVLVLPAGWELSTAAVYGEADRLGLTRTAPDLERCRAQTASFAAAALVNDLQRAAVSLDPRVGGLLSVAGQAGADVVMLSGSGPTVLGLYLGPDGIGRARAAAQRLSGRQPAPAVAEPVGCAFGAPEPI